MILLNDKIFYAHRTYPVRGYDQCRMLLDSLPHWAGLEAPAELERLEEGLVADYHDVLVIYDLRREHAYVLLDEPTDSLRLETDLPMTFCQRQAALGPRERGEGLGDFAEWLPGKPLHVRK